MLDIRYIREHADEVQIKSDQKGYKVNIKDLLSLDSSRRELSTKIDALRQKRNEHAAGLKKGKPTEEQLNEGRELKTDLAKLEEEFNVVDKDFLTALKKVPNMPLADVPVGASEDENVETKKVGDIPKFDFEPKSHYEIGLAKGWIDKERAAKVAGARFAYLKGDLVKLEWALMRFAMDVLTDEETLKMIATDSNLKVSSKAFTPVLPPLVIREELYDAMDRLEPREDRYKIEGDDLWLQGSAEHVLGSMHADEIFDEAELPVRYVGFATSFRKEAGSYGKDMEGIIRMHQFNKLEMESLTTAETSLDEHLFMVAIQEYLMQQLQLPYRVLEKCTYDIGKPNARGVDIDTWFPAQNKYRETHTADLMTDYQARRLQTRVKRFIPAPQYSTGEPVPDPTKYGSKIELVHTNDATVFSQRPLIAILENYQDKDGNVTVPEVLRPYMGNKKVL